jgi:hypothetical protein
MKIIILSDHTQDKIKESENNRERVFQELLSKRRNKIEDKLNHRKELKLKISQDFSNKKYIHEFYNILRIVINYLTPNPKKPVKLLYSENEIIWKSGNIGENNVIDTLNKQLSNEWTAIKGYRNNKGEVDLLLICTYGIIAMEIKYINGHISCNGDTWWKDKFDKYGNLVESNIKIGDKNGRSPSQQVNEVTNALEQFLKTRSINRHIYRMVIFSHKSSLMNKIHNQTVDYIGTIKNINIYKFLSKKNNMLDENEIEKIVTLIKKDHEFHNNN